jgi:hypothetical protein
VKEFLWNHIRDLDDDVFIFYWKFLVFYLTHFILANYYV